MHKIEAVNSSKDKTGSLYKIVVPFYVYAAVSFLASTVLLFFSSNAFAGHYFNPQLLAITHIMALGWGTMIILGASYQLIPVLAESDLYSRPLAFISFMLAAIGIPLLIHAFYAFQFGIIAKLGAVLVNSAIVIYLINAFATAVKSKTSSINILFVLTAGLWLFATTVVGLLLIWNFTVPLLDKDSLHYLSLHAHIGIVGWFLMMVIGVGSRLLPMFLISKYEDDKMLCLIYSLINGSLLLFILLFFFSDKKIYFILPVAGVLSAVLLFFRYCRKIYKARLRKRIDTPTKVSLLAIAMFVIPIIALSVVIIPSTDSETSSIATVYGFTIFFGWLTSIILGMTFKTLPFIVWSKVYQLQDEGIGRADPKDLFRENIFKLMGIAYLIGFILFTCGILFHVSWFLKAGSAFLIIAAFLYNSNVFTIISHKRTA